MSKHALGDGPIDEKYRLKMAAVMSTVDYFLNDEKKGADRDVGIVLLVFPVGEESRCNFMSNGIDRKEIVTLFKEMIARFEGQPEMQGRA